MGGLSLDHLQTFYLVAKYGSFSAAARALHISYQSAANHIRRLEQLLAGPLVVAERGSRSVTLTPRGRSLYRLLAPELDIMLERLAEVVERQRPVLRIGLPQAVLYHLFPGVLQDFQTRCPEVRLQMLERDTALAELLADGSLDVAISERFFGDPAIVQRLIGTYRLVLIHPAAWTPPAALEEIPAWAAGRPFVTYEPGQTLRTLAMDYLALDGKVPDVVLSASSTGCVQRFVRAGVGFSIVPAWTVDPRWTEMRALTLAHISEVKLYFCQLQFLEGNAYVKALFAACASMLQDRPEAAGGPVQASVLG